MNKKKIVHVKIIDGDAVQVKRLLTFFKTSELNKEYEFIVTNENIEFSDIKGLIKLLYDLYKKTEKFRGERKIR